MDIDLDSFMFIDKLYNIAVYTKHFKKQKNYDIVINHTHTLNKTLDHIYTLTAIVPIEFNKVTDQHKLTIESRIDKIYKKYNDHSKKSDEEIRAIWLNKFPKNNNNNNKKRNNKKNNLKRLTFL